MNRQAGFPTLFVSLIVTALLTSPAFAAVEYGAEIVDVEGTALATIAAKKETVEAAVGLRLAVGDSIETGADAEAEILFDDGNVTRMDENSQLLIAQLSIEDDNSRKSVLNLAIGRVKNSVTKLVHKRSAFEVHTKSAVAGVTGTPQWVVSAFEGEKHTTEVDLLGASGDEGEVFVKGTDPDETVVILTPGFRTIVEFGVPPLEPFAIDPDRLNRLRIIIPIKTTDEKMEEKREEILQKSEEKAEEEVREAPSVELPDINTEDILAEQVSVGGDRSKSENDDWESDQGDTDDAVTDDEGAANVTSTVIRLNINYQ